MTETNDKTAEQDGSQELTGQQQITFHHHYIKDLSLENPGAPKNLGDSSLPHPEMTINVKASSRVLSREDRRYEVMLVINATAKRQDETVYIAEIAYGGDISLPKDVHENMIHPLVMIEGPRHLFPFVRMLLSTITREAGFPPLNVQPIDFVRLYELQMQNRQRQMDSQDANQTGNGSTPIGGATKKKPAPTKAKKTARKPSKK